MAKQNPQPPVDTPEASPPPKKWGDRFDTPEALEEAYKSSSAEAGRLKKIADELAAEKETLLSQYATPDDYALPDGVFAPEETINNLKAVAKDAGMTQAQFEKSVRKITEVEGTLQAQRQAKQEAEQKEYAEKRAKLPQDELFILEDFVKNRLPKPIGDAILSNITDPTVYQAALKLRKNAVDNRLEGATSVGTTEIPVKALTDEDVFKARDAWQKQPHRIDLRDEYIKQAGLLGQQKRAQQQK